MNTLAILNKLLHLTLIGGTTKLFLLLSSIVGKDPIETLKRFDRIQRKPEQIQCLQFPAK